MNDGNVMKYLRNDNDISWACQFCGHPFRWEVQPQTFRHHLTMICKSVEDDVREAAAWFFEAECSRYGGSRTASTSVASNSVAQAGKEAEAETEGSRYDQGAEVQPERFRHHLTRMCESTPEDVKESAQRREVEAEECSSVEVNWEPTRILDAPENNDSNFEAEAKVSSVKRTRREGSVQSGNKSHRIMPNTLPIVPEVEFLEGIQETGESASLTNRPMGEAFVRNEKDIWSWLMDDQGLRVGICGMGGVGKTTLMRHIQARIFVKVYKSGSCGRSLDITKFSSYNELRSELARMFGLEGQLEDPVRSGWQLVYVDLENDVLLLGNDPWLEFVNCVWCIRILSPQEVQQMVRL